VSCDLDEKGSLPCLNSIGLNNWTGMQIKTYIPTLMPNLLLFVIIQKLLSLNSPEWNCCLV